MMTYGKRSKTGVALVTTLFIMVVFVILGVSIVGLVTNRSRFSLKRSNDSICRETALAALSIVQSKLNAEPTWENAASFINIADVPFPENNCSCTVTVDLALAEKVAVTSCGYLKDSAGNRVREKVIRATFMRNNLEYSLIDYMSGLNEPMVITDSTIGGKMASQKTGGDIQISNVIPPPASTEQVTVVLCPGMTVNVGPQAVVIERKDIISAPNLNFSISSTVTKDFCG